MLIADELAKKSHIQVSEKRRQLHESAIPLPITKIEDADPLAFLDTATDMSSFPSEVADIHKKEAAVLCGEAQEEGLL